MMSPAKRATLISLGVLLLTQAGATVAQTPYPSKPVRLVVPYPAGTSPDIVARLWGEKFTKATGQAVVVENKAGASTIIGTQAVMSAPADGYTLLWTVNNTFSINPYVFKKLPYSIDDFVPVSQILSVPFVLFVSSDSSIRSLADLIREAKAKPGKLAYASGGVGTGLHAAMARMLNMAGADMLHVPYKESFVTDVIAQRIDVAFDASTGAIPNLKGGKIRALAVTSSKRISQLPDVPSISEAYPGYTGDSWHGVFAPKGTPTEVIDLLAKQTQQIVASPDFQAALQSYALTPVGSSREAFKKFIADDSQAWAKVIRDNRIAVD